MTFKQAVYIPISGKTRETRVPDQESHWVPTLETFFFPRLEVKRWYTVLISYRRNSKSLEAFEYQHCPISSQLKHVFSRRILAFEIFPPYTANRSFTRHSWHGIHFTKPPGTFFAWRIHCKILQINPLYSAEYIPLTLTVHPLKKRRTLRVAYCSTLVDTIGLCSCSKIFNILCCSSKKLILPQSQIV